MQTSDKNNKDMFKDYVNDALSNVAAWNKKVKLKEYTINSKDSYPIKLMKIYRYANSHEEAEYNGHELY
tara:strand:+ start:171 stop:377 length:207 start_codon:yes stop_codon:yes gene_type:complete